MSEPEPSAMPEKSVAVSAHSDATVAAAAAAAVAGAGATSAGAPSHGFAVYAEKEPAKSARMRPQVYAARKGGRQAGRQSSRQPGLKANHKLSLKAERTPGRSRGESAEQGSVSKAGSRPAGARSGRQGERAERQEDGAEQPKDADRRPRRQTPPPKAPPAAAAAAAATPPPAHDKAGPAAAPAAHPHEQGHTAADAGGETVRGRRLHVVGGGGRRRHLQRGPAQRPHRHAPAHRGLGPRALLHHDRPAASARRLGRRLLPAHHQLARAPAHPAADAQSSSETEERAFLSVQCRESSGGCSLQHTDVHPTAKMVRGA